jgi:hypothetical protein
MTPLHRRAETALTELARIDCLLVQGYTGGAIATRHRAAREEMEAILREAGVIPGGGVRAHWLDQPAEAAAGPPGVVSLDAARMRRRENGGR